VDGEPKASTGDHPAAAGAGDNEAAGEETAAGATARAEIRAIVDDTGHAVVNARRAIERVDLAFAEGALHRTPTLDRMLGDLRAALEQDDGQKLGGKSAEAARFILRAILREFERA
jgi:hypothetical protein